MLYFYTLKGLVVEGKGEHTLQPIQRRFAPRFVGMQDSFTAGMGGEAVAQIFQFPAQFQIIVNRTIGDQAEPVIFAVERLSAAREVDDGQPRVRQSDATRCVKALSVGAAMRQPPRHFLKSPPIRFRCFQIVTRDSTHAA